MKKWRPREVEPVAHTRQGQAKPPARGHGPPARQQAGGWAVRALTDVHGVGELLGRQDGVLQGVLVVGGWWLVISVVFHRHLFLLVGGLVVTIVLLILIVVGTFIVIFFLPTRTGTGTARFAEVPWQSTCLRLPSLCQATQWHSLGDRPR